jgi:hypothetical protein
VARRTAFDPASEEPYRRRVTDWVLLVVCTVVLAGLTMYAGHPSTVAVNSFRLVRDLPTHVLSAFRILSPVGHLLRRSWGCN